MPEIIDLSTLSGGGDLPPDDRRIDRSGKPVPENVRVQLNSGIVIGCAVRYDGTDPADGTRRYNVVAELDWENYWPTLMIVGVYPSDVTLTFHMPDDMTETEGWRRAQSMQVIVEKQLHVPPFKAGLIGRRSEGFA
jgi:hypothetical protein